MKKSHTLVIVGALTLLGGAGALLSLTTPGKAQASASDGAPAPTAPVVAAMAQPQRSDKDWAKSAAMMKVLAQGIRKAEAEGKELSGPEAAALVEKTKKECDADKDPKCSALNAVDGLDLLDIIDATPEERAKVKAASAERDRAAKEAGARFKNGEISRAQVMNEFAKALDAESAEHRKILGPERAKQIHDAEKGLGDEIMQGVMDGKELRRPAKK